MTEQRLQEMAAAPVVEPPYDPACVDCRRAVGEGLAGASWQCVGHVYLERNRLREQLTLEKACRERNWNDLKWVRSALDNECRLSESLTAQRDAALAERDALRVQVDQWRQMADREVTACVEMRAERDEARRVLREVQWDRSGECPMCGGLRDGDTHVYHASHVEVVRGHFPACALAAVLAQEEEA